ncbi:hypothetical protein HAX54_036735 [Datura stramonium]|uniref:AB hydrolase-1 domain-containing protein n=1 Tax=Datura stramonium TaxID=4076 RepID=A0ABS8SGF1_DATST|nr:hypothetical protein [Datura stramonium]
MRSSGQNVTVIDLGASGINPKQVLEITNLSDYFSPLTEFMASLPTHEKVVLSWTAALKVDFKTKGPSPLTIISGSLVGPKWAKAATKHFVLVHGACHGAWSWYKIVALIKSSGHNVTAVDLGASGINPKRVLEIPHLSDYFSPLMEFMASLPADEKVVLVGHNLGGFAISRAMESFPQKILVAIFVTAGMPGPTLNATTIYSKDLALATTLVRPIYLYSTEDISKEMVLSSKRYGSVRRVFVVAAEDKILTKEFQLSMIEKNPPDEVKEISGSDHMVMMSKPLELFTTLLHIANH